MVHDVGDASNPAHRKIRPVVIHPEGSNGQKRIIARLGQLSQGHWGDCKAVGGNILELRIHCGPGYRVYCWPEGATVVVALGGGDKSTQQRDISAAQAMVETLKE